jgi:hypothetical protein
MKGMSFGKWTNDVFSVGYLADQVVLTHSPLRLPGYIIYIA